MSDDHRNRNPTTPSGRENQRDQRKNKKSRNAKIAWMWGGKETSGGGHLKEQGTDVNNPGKIEGLGSGKIVCHHC